MNKVIKLTLLAGLILLVIASPFIFAFDLQEWMLNWTDPANSKLNDWQFSLIVFGILSVDIFLPVPSSGIATYCGAWFSQGFLRALIAILICTAGMTVSVLVGYWAGRFLGFRLVQKLSRDQDMSVAHHWLDRFGASFLILLRGVPLMAEASVLVAGSYRMRFGRMLLATCVGNLIYSTIYVAFGYFAYQSDWLPTAILVSLVIPLFGLFLIRGFRRERDHQDQQPF